MQPRVFVVMPFGKKAVDTSDGPKTLDYNQLYAKLLKPALLAAGCEPFRADQETAVGDIRNDMFFELVTADAILADVSIGNANVFYELGVRHGVNPRGAFMIHGGWSDFRPFDLAPDRTFSYPGQLFLTEGEPDAKTLNAEIERLASTLRNAFARDRTTIGSPVYSSLPGLEPADWRGIRTARSKYFTGVLDDWKERVRVARKNGHPGDIVTLADDAPTRFHRQELLLESVRGLLDLLQFEIAEIFLREVLEINPDHFDAQCWLGMVLGRRGKIFQAEEHLKRVRQMHPEDPDPQSKLARLYKDLWRSHWEHIPAIGDRHSEAVNWGAQAVSAINGYYAALLQHPESYFYGINVLVLSSLLQHLATLTGDGPGELPPVDLHQLRSVVSFNAVRSLANSQERIWAVGTLGMLAALEGDVAQTRRRMREVAGSPDLTLYHRQSISHDLTLMKSLEYQSEAVDVALKILPPAPLKPQFRRVFVFSGHMIDAPGRSPSRFPAEKESAVREALAAHLERWQAGEGDLAVSGAAHGGDILFAELCREHKAHVRLLLAQAQSDYLESSVRGRASNWVDRFFSLRETSEVREQPEQLGRPPESVSPHKRNNLWILNTARVEATPDRLFALLVWDGERTPGLYGTSHFADRVVKLGGRLEIVNPTQL
jgi:tetratricopeptide (TPR) repeat protein